MGVTHRHSDVAVTSELTRLRECRAAAEWSGNARTSPCCVEVGKAFFSLVGNTAALQVLFDHQPGRLVLQLWKQLRIAGENGEP